VLKPQVSSGLVPFVQTTDPTSTAGLISLTRYYLNSLSYVQVSFYLFPSLFVCGVGCFSLESFANHSFPYELSWSIVVQTCPICLQDCSITRDPASPASEQSSPVLSLVYKRRRPLVGRESTSMKSQNLRNSVPCNGLVK
jgi:hypothetical protein